MQAFGGEGQRLDGKTKKWILEPEQPAKMYASSLFVTAMPPKRLVCLSVLQREGDSQLQLQEGKTNFC